MSLLDELKQEIAGRNSPGKMRTQLEELRRNAQDAFNTQFRLNASDEQQIALLKGRLAAFDECLDVFECHDEQRQERKKQLLDDEECV